MAVENFLHDSDGVSTTVSQMKEYLESYKTQITSLENLINTMSGSGSWKDEEVKTSFIATAMSYVSAYKSFSAGLEGYINSLNQKSTNLSEHESVFS
jgi:uncharacterized protein YukE